MNELKKFEERRGAFEAELAELQKKHQVGFYAVNVAMPNAEVHPVIKMFDSAEKQEEKE